MMGFWRTLKKVWQHRSDEVALQWLAVGINSSTDITQDCHIVMLDYDIKELDRVVASIEELQGFWNLADAHVFRTMKGFHVFFWYDQVPYGRLRQIVDYARDVDPLYKLISRYYDHKTVRVSGKYSVRDIAFVGIVPGPREASDKEKEVGELKRREHLMLLDPESRNWGASLNEATQKR